MYMQSLPERINALVSLHGGLRAAGKATNIDAAYLKRLRDGHKTNPSDETIDKLGLRKEIVYVLK